MTKELPLEKIRIDGNTQPRVKLDNATVAEYAEQMSAGVEFPAVVVFHDGTDYWLAAGFHRYFASKKAELLTINSDVRKGTLQDARDFATSSNTDHGLKRTNDDKRKQVGMTLEDHADWSDRKIADHCSVSHDLVADMRKLQVAESPPEPNAKRTGKDGKKQAATKQKPASKSSPATALDSAPPEDKAKGIPEVIPVEGCAVYPVTSPNKPKVARADATLARAQTDDAGNSVPEALLEVFEDRDTFLQLQRDLNEIAGRVSALKKRASGRDIKDGLASRLESAAEEIALASPSTVNEKGKWFSRGAAK